ADDLVASAPGYWPQSKLVQFEDGTTTTTDFDLLRRCALAKIVGTVVNALTQAPIEGAEVYGSSFDVRTDAAGRFELDDVEPGIGNNPLAVSLTAAASGFISQTKVVTVFCGATIVV